MRLYGSICPIYNREVNDDWIYRTSLKRLERRIKNDKRKIWKKEDPSCFMAREVVFPAAWQNTQLCHEGKQ